MKCTDRLRNHLLKQTEESVVRLDAKLGKEGRVEGNKESLHSNLFLCATPYVYHLSVKTPVWKWASVCVHGEGQGGDLNDHAVLRE